MMIWQQNNLDQKNTINITGKTKPGTFEPVPFWQRFRSVFMFQTTVVILAGLVLSYVFGTLTAQYEFENSASRDAESYSRVLSRLLQRGDFIGIEENVTVLVSNAILAHVELTNSDGFALVDYGRRDIDDPWPIVMPLLDHTGTGIGMVRFQFDHSSIRERSLQFVLLCALLLLLFSLTSFLIMSQFTHRMLVLPIQAITQAWSHPQGKPAISTAKAHSVELAEMERAFQQALERAQMEVHVDELTRVLNRKAFNQFLEQNRDKIDKLAMFIVDIDDFKLKNDRFGHFEADNILAKVARKLVEVAAGDGLVYRIGGDEFAILCTRPEKFDLLAERVGERMTIHYSGDHVSDIITLSIGFARMPQDVASMAELQQMADRAMYKTKSLRQSNIARLSTSPG